MHSQTFRLTIQKHQHKPQALVRVLRVPSFRQDTQSLKGFKSYEKSLIENIDNCASEGCKLENETRGPSHLL